MSTMQVDQECVDLKTQVQRLITFVDGFHKRSNYAKNCLRESNPVHKDTIMKLEAQTRAVELIAQQMESLFKVVVLTEPRE